MVVNSLTVTLTVIGTMVSDKTSDKLKSFYTAPEKTSSGKSSPPVAFAGDLEPLSLRESALGAKIRMSERSEFGFLSLLLADFRKLRGSVSET